MRRPARSEGYDQIGYLFSFSNTISTDFAPFSMDFAPLFLYNYADSLQFYISKLSSPIRYPDKKIRPFQKLRFNVYSL